MLSVEQALAFELAEGVVWRRWGDETVVYVERNFKTHLLNLAGGLVLDALASKGAACTVTQILELLLGEEWSSGPHAQGVNPDIGWLHPLLEQLMRHEVIVARAC